MMIVVWVEVIVWVGMWERFVMDDDLLGGNVV